MNVVIENDISRRGFAKLLAGAALAGPAVIAASETKDLPLISKRVEKVFQAPGEMPNGLQAMADGLWILDQKNPNRVHKVRYEDGSVIQEIVTEGNHGSGITFGNDALWIASTFGLTTLKVDARSGKTLAVFDTPGVGQPQWGKPLKRKAGAHGLEWVDGKYWIAVPPPMKIYQIEPETGKVLHSIPAPGERPHGIAWDGGYLWCVESNHRAIYKMDPVTGKLLAKIPLGDDNPEPHGMSMHNGQFWYCDAVSRWVCRLV